MLGADLPLTRADVERIFDLLAEAAGQRAAVAKLDGRALAERLAADVAAVRLLFETPPVVET